jgi:hypothetical protein
MASAAEQHLHYWFVALYKKYPDPPLQFVVSASTAAAQSSKLV